MNNEALEAAEAHLAAATAKAEALSGKSNAATAGGLTGYDSAILSGIRRKPNAKADSRRFNAYDREAAAWKAVEDAEFQVKLVRGRIATAQRNKRIPFTEEQYKAAQHVRTELGWHKVVRVNAKSVSVETGYSWTDRIVRDKIIEVR